MGGAMGGAKKGRFTGGGPGGFKKGPVKKTGHGGFKMKGPGTGFNQMRMGPVPSKMGPKKGFYSF
jgi:hypothetical protein